MTDLSKKSTTASVVSSPLKSGTVKRNAMIPFGIFAAGEDPKSGATYYNVENTAGYLQTELMVDFQTERDYNLMEAINNPTEFMVKRNAKMREFVKPDGAIDVYFKSRMKELLDMGLPPEHARAMALKASKNLYQDHVNVLEMKWPGLYEKAYGVAQENNDNFHQKAKNLGVHPAETVAEYKLRKKAKLALGQ